MTEKLPDAIHYEVDDEVNDKMKNKQPIFFCALYRRSHHQGILDGLYRKDCGYKRYTGLNEGHL